MIQFNKIFIQLENQGIVHHYFMYGIEIPSFLNNRDDLESILHLADFYMMEDLKGAASFLIAEGLNTENVFDLSHLAERYRAEALADRCAQFLFEFLAGNDGKPYWVAIKFLEILTPPAKL